jgi:hypothetical protein
LRLLQPRRIRLKIYELERIGGTQAGVEYFILVIVEKLRQSCPRIDPEMLVALGTNVEVIFNVFLPDNLTAAFTLDPQPLGTDFLLARSVQLAGFSFKPGHKIGRWPLYLVSGVGYLVFGSSLIVGGSPSVVAKNSLQELIKKVPLLKNFVAKSSLLGGAVASALRLNLPYRYPL